MQFDKQGRRNGGGGAKAHGGPTAYVNKKCSVITSKITSHGNFVRRCNKKKACSSMFTTSNCPPHAYPCHVRLGSRASRLTCTIVNTPCLSQVVELPSALCLFHSPAVNRTLPPSGSNCIPSTFTKVAAKGAPEARWRHSHGANAKRLSCGIAVACTTLKCWCASA